MRHMSPDDRHDPKRRTGVSRTGSTRASSIVCGLVVLLTIGLALAAGCSDGTSAGPASSPAPGAVTAPVAGPSPAGATPAPVDAAAADPDAPEPVLATQRSALLTYDNPAIAGRLIAFEQWGRGEPQVAVVVAASPASDGPHETTVIAGRGARCDQPAADRGTIVWVDHRSDGGDIRGRRVRLAGDRLVTTARDTFTVCAGRGAQSHPAISGDVVVWQDDRDGDWNIYGRDLGSGAVFPVCVAAGDQTNPAVAGDIVVWQDRRDGEWKIRGIDLDEKRELAVPSSGGAQTAPAVSRSAVVWQDGADRQIHVAKIKEGYVDVEQSVVSPTGKPQRAAAISGWIVVWNDFRGDAWDIYSFDLSTGAEQYVSTSPEDQVHPDVDGRLVTYVCRNGRPAVADARLR